MELDVAVGELSGVRTPSAQSMSPAEWNAYRRRVAGSEEDGDEPSAKVLARLEAEHPLRSRPPGQTWFDYQERTPRRRWRALLAEPVTALKSKLGMARGVMPGIDEPLADALAAALRSPVVREQAPLAPSARRRGQAIRTKPDMKLGMLMAKWKAARKPIPKAAAAMETAVTYFTSYIGDVGIGEIAADDCDAQFVFSDLLDDDPFGDGLDYLPWESGENRLRKRRIFLQSLVVSASPLISDGELAAALDALLAVDLTAGWRSGNAGWRKFWGAPIDRVCTVHHRRPPLGRQPDADSRFGSLFESNGVVLRQSSNERGGLDLRLSVAIGGGYDH